MDNVKNKVRWFRKWFGKAVEAEDKTNYHLLLMDGCGPMIYASSEKFLRDKTGAVLGRLGILPGAVMKVMNEFCAEESKHVQPNPFEDTPRAYYEICNMSCVFQERR